MFVTVRYGDNKHQIFNRDCRNTILLHYIKTRCSCQPEDVIDLSDEKGAAKNLRLNPLDYAKEYLKNRESLILLRVDKPVAASSTSPDSAQTRREMFTPLLFGLADNSEFMETLNPVREEDARSEGSSKSSRRRSSTFDMDDLNRSNSSKSKTKTSLHNATKKTAAKRGHRPPLRKTTTAS